MANLFDPLKAREALDEKREGEPGASEVARVARKDRQRARISEGQVFEAGLAASGASQDAQPLNASTSLSTPKDPMRNDFRVFLTALWRHLGLPDPTPIQLAIAHWLQHGPDRAVLLAFRGASKSWITAAYALWCLYVDPQEKILVVSASLPRAVAFVNFCITLIRECPFLQHLMPKPHQRQGSQAFDVGPARPAQSASLTAYGIGGQLPGLRATKIIPDDVEVPNNSMTVLMREKISERVKEFDSILVPGGKIKFLGTPQVDASLYVTLIGRGYAMAIFPSEYPNAAQIKRYGSRLAPYILHRLKKDPSLVGKSTEPSRFSDEDLARRKLSLGKSTYALQFLLDTSLADKDRYPLKVSDLIVTGLDLRKGPDSITWGRSDELVQKDLPLMGFEGDHYYGPASIAKEYSPYNRIVAWIDPSGEGEDETSLNIVAELHGMVFLLYTNGWVRGHHPQTRREIAQALVKYNVSEAFIESNFGDGMFLSLIQPDIERAWKEANKNRREDLRGGTKLEEVRSQRVQKELRILSALEGTIQAHRLVIALQVIEDDYASIQKIDGDETRHRYSLFYQLTHLTREKDSLYRDDRIEGLAGAVAQFAEVLGVDPLGMAQVKRDERLDEELEEMFADADEIGGYSPTKNSHRAASARPQRR